MEKCIYCNSANLQRNVLVKQRVEVGAIGLEYKANKILHGVEPFYADLCLDCGSISRLYVKNTARNWLCKDN
jgi:hypothetical protein